MRKRKLDEASESRIDNGFELYTGGIMPHSTQVEIQARVTPLVEVSNSKRLCVGQRNLP